jgi:Trypsin-like peptidase domain
MKKPLLLFYCLLGGVSPLFGTDFAKGDKVELVKETPVYFKDAVLRIGKSGEQFTVILYHPTSHKVYLSSQDALGKEIAVTVLDSEVRKAGLIKPQIPQKKELLQATPEQAVYLVQTKGGSGSAFLAQINGFCYLVTNAHVAASASRIEFKNPLDRITISAGEVEVADDRDMIRFPSEGDIGLILATEVKADDKAIAYGNSAGEGVVTKLPGNILGVGVDKIEISCEIIPGNSGGPILNSQGRVIAVASYATSTVDVAAWIKTGTRFDKARRFGFRLTDDIKWTRIPFAQFVSESTQIQATTEVSDYFAEVLNQLLFHSLESPLVNKFPTNQPLGNFTTTYNRAVSTLGKGDGAFLTDAETKRINSKLKASARMLTADFVRIIDATAADFKFKAEKIKTPYFRKKAEEILIKLAAESQFVKENAKEAFGSDFLK